MAHEKTGYSTDMIVSEYIFRAFKKHWDPDVLDKVVEWRAPQWKASYERETARRREAERRKLQP